MIHRQQFQATHTWMAIYGREDLTIGHQHILILGVLANLHHHLPFNGDQVEDVLTRSQFTHGHRLGNDGRVNRSFLDFAAGKGQETVMHFGEARYVRFVSDPQRLLKDGHDPNAFCAVL